MKLSKKALLATVMAATVTLTACDKLNYQAQAATQKTQVQEQKTTNDAMIAEFGKNIQIKTIARNFVKNDKNEPGLAYSYNITNTGNKAIKTASWVYAYQFENNVIHTHPISLNFEQDFNPNANFNLNVIIPFSTVSPEVKAIFENPKNEISSVAIAREIQFVDGSKITVE
ncbi:hypothetical protein ACT2CV_00520 [Pasteurellaceae bacterium 22721_9_1]